ncbi:type VI secretion system tube protein TssD [Oceanihabitans sp. 2_MG-2023]|uniref:type VI secretion system tube protein TssD n=1 Tax=Oceanihabitans sp. 2_MG-2023 TaxID=3062661 RepID=UPI0026E15C9E|nr:type VI secretion system tube protein TssD [Oceanihabitans sp. 2_MG-2023]MDO6597319.1 type VI secretion system tube protein TssD [Oceanihabitans sp. 2_MG-2023]
MSFKSKLNVGGNEYNVLNCSYELHQETDATGRPSSITRGGKIKITVESTADTSLSDWMFNNFERKDGSITFLKRDTDAKAKELKFTEAYMVNYSEKFDHSGENPMAETVVISAKTIGIGNGEHINEWTK